MTTASSWRTSVARIKGSGTAPLQAAPRAGTRLHALYLLFVERPAAPIARRDTAAVIGGGRFYAALEKLRDYGLDVRRHSRGHWWLVGCRDPLTGRYVDYVAPRVVPK